MSRMFHAENLHTPVSSESDEVELLVEGPSEEPSTGESAPGEPEMFEEDEEGSAGVAALAAEETAPDTSGLQDIAFASFGPRPEAILGTDDRRQVTNTTTYPWRAHASLDITARDGSRWIGTGWFIGPRTLATAGHCIFIKGSGVPGRDGWVQSVRVMPGRNGAQLPYGSAMATSFRSVTGWTNDGNHNHDYGAIILPSNLGSTTGWFGLRVESDSQLNGSFVHLSGYPGDKPAGTQWYHSGRVTNVTGTKTYYTIDTMGGQSGSAVYKVVDGSRYGIAVHAYGGSSANHGTRINRNVFDNLVKWKA